MTVHLQCSGCYRDWEIAKEMIEDRFEIARVHRPSGVYEAAVCPRCGAIVSPGIREVDPDDL